LLCAVATHKAKHIKLAGNEFKLLNHLLIAIISNIYLNSDYSEYNFYISVREGVSTKKL